MKKAWILFVIVVLSGAGCTTVQQEAEAVRDDAQQGMAEFTDTVEKTKKVSDDLQMLSQDLKALFGNEPEADATAVLPNEDPPQP